MAKIDYQTDVISIDGTHGTLADYAGKTLLIVNTASACGFTPQFDGLEKLWSTYGDRGFAVLGFPCNQFGEQDPGSNEEIATYCRINHGVSFPMHERIEVNGDGTHPLFEALKAGAPGLLGSEKIKWNFTKFLVGADGSIIKRFAPNTKPSAIASEIEALLS